MRDHASFCPILYAWYYQQFSKQYHKLLSLWKLTKKYCICFYYCQSCMAMQASTCIYCCPIYPMATKALISKCMSKCILACCSQMVSEVFRMVRVTSNTTFPSVSISANVSLNSAAQLRGTGTVENSADIGHFSVRCVSL